MVRFLDVFTTMLALTLFVPATMAQDTPTMESAAAGECVAPDLPPGTVTPPQDTPAEAAPAEETVPESTPVPAGVPADQATIDRVIAAEQNMMNCFNAGDWEASAALFSPDGLLIFFGSPNPHDAAANLEGYPPQAVVSVENVEVLPDGRLRDEITYTVGKQLTGMVSYWVDHDGVLLLDDFGSLPEPLEAPVGASVVEVEMVDYAFVLSEYTVPAAEAIIVRTSIRSVSGSDHVATLMSCPAGTTAEQLILGEVDYLAACPDHHGQMYLRPSQPGDHDMILLGLEPGTYFLVCDVLTPGGASHHKLGMAAEITVE